jgi:hypothetical protein
MLITLLLLADLKALIEKNGATFTTAITEECTHLVTTEKDVEKQTMKCECATTEDLGSLEPLRTS